MHSEDVKKIKCDRCSAVIGLYRYNDDGWRCSLCIWKERENLIEQIKDVLNNSDYYYSSGKTTKVYRKNMDALNAVVQKVESLWRT